MKPYRDLKIFDVKDFPAYLPKLNALYDDLFASGKGFRSKLIQMVSGHLQVDKKAQHLLAQTIEFIHNASLLHDDLVDRSQLRRSKPAAWLKYSPEYAVLAGDYLLARVMVNLSRYGNLRLIQYTSEIISDLLEGEWIQDSLMRDWNVGLAQLDQVHNLKTASLFKWCLKAPFLCIENYDDRVHHILEELGGILGLLFQRSDDLLDFNVRNYEGKNVLGDLKSGYFNSFSAFLTKNMNTTQKTEFRNCITIEELEKVLGPGRLQAAVAEFDTINKRFIDLYFHQCDMLKAYLTPSQQGLIDDLRKLPEPLYWRKA